MKGVSEIIAEILIVAMAVGLMSFFYQYYSSSSQNAMHSVEDEGSRVNCERLSNFMITGVTGDNISIKNAGGTIINSSHFSGYINDVPVLMVGEGVILNPGESASFRLGQVPALGSRVKVIGDCKVGDEFYVK
jgi:hypothetical protein